MLGNKIRVSCSMILMLMMLALPIAQAECPHGYFTAEINLTTGFCDETELYIMKIKLDAGASQEIGSVAIEIPSGWTSTAVLYVFADQPNWIQDSNSTHIRLKTTGPYRLLPGQSVWVVFSTHSPGAGIYYWTTTAYIATGNEAWTSSQYCLQGPQPSVTISCPACWTTTTDTWTTETLTSETLTTETLTTETLTSETLTTETLTTETLTSETLTTETLMTETYTAPGAVYVFAGTPLGPIRVTKPAGTVSAAWIDSTAAAVLEGMLAYPKFSFDTDSEYVDQLTGQPVQHSVSVFVASGGPLVNGPVAYYEQHHEYTGAPVYYGSPEPGYAAFFEVGPSDTEIPLTRVATNLLGPSLDYFLIECFTDNLGNTVLIIYGYGGRGTFAGALYYKEVLHPTGMPSDPGGDMFTPGWWIYRWNDLNGNGLPDIDEDGWAKVAGTS